MTEHKVNKRKRFLWLIPVAALLYGTSALMDWKTNGGNWGEYWGISEEGWAGIWATVLSASLAAGVAIYVLRGQNIAQATAAELDRKHASEQADKDRRHQAELARRDRDIASSVGLRENLQGYIEAVERHWRNDQPIHPEERHKLRLRLETAAYRWGVNSGLESSRVRPIVAMILSSATNLEDYDDSGPWSFFRRGQYDHLYQLLGDVFLHLPNAPDEKWPVFERHIDYYHQELVPLVGRFHSFYEGKHPEIDRRGNPVNYKIEISESEAIRLGLDPASST